MNRETVAAGADRVLSFEKLYKDARTIKRKRPLIDRLKRIRSKIDHCRIPEIIVSR